jgi:cadmium resistance protein CadD (predicted permease)
VPSAEKHASDEALSFAEYVPKTYQGAATDRHETNMLSKKQVLKRQFTLITMLGFASTVGKCEVYIPCFRSS